MHVKLTLAAIVLASLVSAAGCGGSSDEASGDEAPRDETSTAVVTESAPAETTTKTEGTTRGDPIRCLDAAGLSDVEERDVGIWSGLHEGPAYAIVVHKLAKPAKAPVVVAGTYAVTGSFKVAAEGTGLTSEEGLLADALVQDVAACLGG
jgi:outer membrane murein-binding lipoprotein Lpp